MEKNNKNNNNCDMWCDMIDIDTSYNIVSKSTTSSLSNSLLLGLDNPLSNSVKFNIVMDTNVHEGQNLSVDEIVQLDYTTLTELSLLKHQSYIILQLKKYVTSCKNEKIKFNTIMHIEKLKWLLKTTCFLSEYRKLTKIKSKKHATNKSLKRNSYEFCEKNSLCQYHIDNKCKKKHFVYNFIVCDIEELVNYIENNDMVSIDEIYVSVNTISYVINHMKDELYHLSK
jgi:hypothetical protein